MEPVFTIKFRDKKSKARVGILRTPSGTIETPFFMPVATKATVKHISSEDLYSIGIKAVISNSFILHLSPGDSFIKKLGGIKKFMNFEGINITDSGGFQMYSDSCYISSTSEGAWFRNPFNNQKIFITPEKSMRIQLNIGADIAMCLDRMPLFPSTKSQIKEAIEKTIIWAKKCKSYHEKLQKNIPPKKKQLLFGISQGGIFQDLRKACVEELSKLDFDGYAIGGLALGEKKEQRYKAIEAHKSVIPENKVTYLMGVGDPIEILEAISRGVDMFDSRYPTQNARRGTLFSTKGKVRIFNSKNKKSSEPIDKNCKCFVCRNYSKAYISYLLKHREGNGLRLATFHNLYYIHNLIEEAKSMIKKGKFEEFKEKIKKIYKE